MPAAEDAGTKPPSPPVLLVWQLHPVFPPSSSTVSHLLLCSVYVVPKLA